MFRPLEDLRADPAVVDLKDWSGLVLRVRVMINNNDTVEHVGICTSLEHVELLAREPFTALKWDVFLLGSLPLLLEAEKWQAGAPVERVDLRPKISVTGFDDPTLQLVPKETHDAEGYPWDVRARRLDAPAIASLLTEQHPEVSFSAERPPFPPWDTASNGRPLSPFYARYGSDFVEWLEQHPFIGPTEGWDGSVASGQWVPAIALTSLEDRLAREDFEEYLEWR